MGRREAAFLVTAGGLALVLALGLPAGATESRMKPAFGEAEQQIIARNESLRRGVRQDPAAVRQALDTLEAKRSGKDAARGRDGTGPFDEKADPDLDGLQRASPEAAYDLFQLLKKASDSGASAPPPKQSR